MLVPVKPFDSAKSRLAPALGPPARAALSRWMATAVVRAAAPVPVAVVCDDYRVAEWARSLGALVIWVPEAGLNRAVSDGVSRLAELGVARVAVVHADLPGAANLASVTEGDGVVIVPDRRENGTNALCVPTGTGFAFAYGPGSFARHMAEARRLGLAVTVDRRADLACDVDVPADLPVPAGAAGPYPRLQADPTLGSACHPAAGTPGTASGPR
ncbi:MAG: 2-phospho-L-lactate guanylyltransferase [Acidimicrobiales bacterium]